ncbi:MAG: protein kinase [Holophaga sp.]|nr:protein kinase [Holophaga sp.]
MSLAPESHLGPYRILAMLGAGGMGEVYRAQDTRLEREVAIKILPEAISGDPKVLARFADEAKAVAALSHPNILALYDVGECEGVRYVVTELLEGETLREAMADQGPLPLKRALSIAEQVARGLAAAHEKGIVHRDLKPENIFLTRDGDAKLLDFGLATWRIQTPSSDPCLDITAAVVSSPGAVVGTVGYMSPEQARGKGVDFRSDQFSLGILLYELLAGTRPFQGASVAETLVAIMREEPQPLDRRVPGLPAPLCWVVDRCLAKQPGDRYGATRDLARDLDAIRQHLSSSPSQLSTPSLRPPGFRSTSLIRRMALILGLSLGALAMVFFLGRWMVRVDPVPRATFQRLTTFDGVEGWPSLSPDGQIVAYQKTIGTRTDVYTLRVGGHNATNLTASQDGNCGEPAFSPDGRAIAFRGEGGGAGIFLMGATGESVRRLTDFGHTPSWFPDGKRLALATEIVLDPYLSQSHSQVWVVDAATGLGRPLSIQGRAYQPSVSPHGRRIAYWGVPLGGAQRDIYTIGPEEGAQPVPVIQDAPLDWSPTWSADGRHLYFLSDRGGVMNLWRVAIDESSGRVKGAPEPVTVPVPWATSLQASIGSPRLVFSALEQERVLERLSFDPERERISGPSNELARFVTAMAFPRPSPKGDLLTFAETGIREDIVVIRSDGSGLRRLTEDDHRNRAPVFSPDGTQIVFYSNRGGLFDLWTMRVDGSGLAPLTQSPDLSRVILPVWNPDGKSLVAIDLEARPLILPYPRRLETPIPPAGPPPGPKMRFSPHTWSPDGKRIAGWVIQEDGSQGGIQIYDPASESYTRLTEKGSCPFFLPDGRRILYLDTHALWVVDMQTKRRREVFRGEGKRALVSFGLTQDGRTLFLFRETLQADLWLVDFKN